MLIVALISTVALLIWMGFFMMSSLPLLILKHDTALDARFIRGLCNIYYVGLMSVATAGALIHAISGRYGIALGVGCMAMIGFAERRWLVGRMDTLRSTMTADDVVGIRQFRRLHITGMVLNALLLGVFCVEMTRVLSGR